MKRIVVLVCAALLCLSLASCSPPRPDHPVIGAKNFTEQVILGELLAQELESKSGMKVERRFYLAGSYICNQALLSGRIDAYVEYTGTALTAILKQPVSRDPDAVLRTIRNLYASRNDVTVAEPLGFENTFAMVIRGDDAKRLNLTTLSQVARYTPSWRLGVGYEFEQRPDGLRGLSAAYNLRFRKCSPHDGSGPALSRAQCTPGRHDRRELNGRSHSGTRSRRASGRSPLLSALSGCAAGAS